MGISGKDSGSANTRDLVTVVLEFGTKQPSVLTAGSYHDARPALAAGEFG